MTYITTVDPDNNGAFMINLECGHTIVEVPSPIACALGQGESYTCPLCGTDNDDL